ncbi:MAG: DUF58 domain-containing protein [Desulfobulbaceae bacterium]|nr:DUF58 domain-containing protein [Desulfobulbaceae bacterium]
MDWSRVKRNTATSNRPQGPYTSLDELVRLQFKVRDFSLKPTQPVTSILSGRYGSRLRGRGLNFEELRRYLSGDDVRTIDWKVTARTRTPHVRVYSEEKDRKVLLLVDQRINMFFGTREKFKSVTAAEAAAIAAWRAIAAGDRVGALVFNDETILDTKPGQSSQTVLSILGNIVKLNHLLTKDTATPPNDDMMNRCLESAARLAPHDVLVVLITDGSGLDDSGQQLISKIGQKNDIITLLIHDPSRLELQERPLTLSDGKRQMEVDFSNDKVRKTLLEHYAKEQSQLQHFLRKLTAPLLPISNQGDVGDQLRRLLGVVPRR